MVALEQSPPGFNQDEASESYDAYSLWHTGRDQHGVFLPATLGSFNDYRGSLFSYSMAPLVGLGGLSVMTARLTAAFWGILAVAAAYWVGARMFGRTSGVVAALFLALSPWHVPFSRIAYEGSVTALMSVLAVGMLWQWRRTCQSRWIIGAAIAAGLGVYTYSVMKLFLSVMIAVLGLFFWRTVIAHRRQVLLAVFVGGLLTFPMVYDTVRHYDMVQARYRQISVFQPGRPLGNAVAEAARNLWHNVSPDFLFGQGDLYQVHHPKGLGQLYPIQAVLIVAGVAWGLRKPQLRLPLAITGVWILAGVLPAALTVYAPQTGHAFRSLPAAVPWQLLSGLGLAGLLNVLKPQPARLAIILTVLGWVGANATGYFDYYFTRYPSDAARLFEVGMREAVTTMDRLDDEYDAVYFDSDINYYPYIDILFFTRYDPHLLQADLPERVPGLFAPVLRVGKYHTVYDTEALWEKGLPGLFVVPANELPDVSPLAITPGPGGQPLFKIVGRHFFPYDISNLAWFSQCTRPVLPLSEAFLAYGIRREDLRRADFDCTSAWLYPAGESRGAYVMHRDLVPQASPGLPSQSHPTDPFIARHLRDMRLAFSLSEPTERFTAFVIYEQERSPALPTPSCLLALPAASLPAITASLTTPVALEGSLTFLGTTVYTVDEGMDIETWWQVTRGPITRPLSIMAHLLTSEGQVLGTADGMGVPPIVWNTGDVIVQLHRFPQPTEGTTVWLRTGAYWLDTMERWQAVDVPGADALFVLVKGR